MATGAASSTAKWLSYFADNGILEDESPSNLMWPVQQHGGTADCSADGPAGRTDETEDSQKEASASRKRQREEPCKESAGSKANREKLRRDRLNDRFVELSRALEADKPPKTDKATILCDAVRVIGQLRQEAISLKEGNAQLKEQIKELKAEKNELREEKAKLKAEKERLETQVKALSRPTSYTPPGLHTAAFAAQAAHTQPPFPAKLSTPAAMSPVAMWQWLPPASLDTSRDHVLRPPVA